MAELAGRCALVVPCYNESQRLRTGAFIAYLRSAPQGFRLIFVDDGSTDNTLEVLHRLQTEAGDAVLVLPKKPNGGKAEAVRYGMNHAVTSLDVDVTGFWDADLATPLHEVQPMLDVLREVPQIEMVFGARVKLLGRRVERKVARHYLGRVFATVVSNLLDLPIYDTQCGAKLFRITPDFREVLRTPFLSRWIFDVEVIARFIQMWGPARVHDAIYEYPLREWEDVAGSKLRSGDFFKAIGEILAIRRQYLSGGQPRPPLRG